VIARNAKKSNKSCAVTRKCIKKLNNSDTDNAIKYPKDDDIVDFPDVNRKTLIDLKKSDNTLQNLFDLSKNTDQPNPNIKVVVDDDLLVRYWLPANTSSKVLRQIIVLKKNRPKLMHIAHTNPFGAHMGVNKTQDRLLQCFYWPSLWKDVQEYCTGCLSYQQVGKPQDKNVSPLISSPIIEEPFSRVAFDLVGPLPASSDGYKYILTIVNSSSVLSLEEFDLDL
jgi:hypothetical protein